MAHSGLGRAEHIDRRLSQECIQPFGTAPQQLDMQVGVRFSVHMNKFWNPLRRVGRSVLGRHSGISVSQSRRLAEVVCTSYPL